MFSLRIYYYTLSVKGNIMREIYSEEFTVTTNDVNKYRFLRTSRMFTILQTVSTNHLDAVDMGPDKTLEHGLLWVLIKQTQALQPSLQH